MVELFVAMEKVFARYCSKVTAGLPLQRPVSSRPASIWTRCVNRRRQNTGTWMQWNHHKGAGGAEWVKLFREKGYRGSVGCILSPEVTYPHAPAHRMTWSR